MAAAVALTFYSLGLFIARYGGLIGGARERSRVSR
jgi:hypothetical protein